MKEKAFKYGSKGIKVGLSNNPIINKIITVHSSIEMVIDIMKIRTSTHKTDN